ncbi:MAG: hypothetical protein ACP5N1_06245 [Candidatus Woesearchaeota archaeon]
MNISYKTTYIAGTGLSALIFILTITGQIKDYNNTIFFVDSLICLITSLICWVRYDMASSVLEASHRTMYEYEDRNTKYELIFGWWIGIIIATILISVIVQYLSQISVPTTW